MRALTIEYPDELLLTGGHSAADVEQELKLLLAVKLFEMRRLSLGKAAGLCGLAKLRFMDELARMKVPAINLDDDQIGDELRDD